MAGIDEVGSPSSGGEAIAEQVKRRRSALDAQFASLRQRIANLHAAVG